jgi:archaellum component FlaD/FlaE
VDADVAETVDADANAKDAGVDTSELDEKPAAGETGRNEDTTEEKEEDAESVVSIVDKDADAASGAAAEDAKNASQPTPAPAPATAFTFRISDKLKKMQRRDADVFGASNWTNKFHAKGCPCCD